MAKFNNVELPLYNCFSVENLPIGFRCIKNGSIERVYSNGDFAVAYCFGEIAGIIDENGNEFYYDYDKQEFVLEEEE